VKFAVKTRDFDELFSWFEVHPTPSTSLDNCGVPTSGSAIWHVPCRPHFVSIGWKFSAQFAVKTRLMKIVIFKDNFGFVGLESQAAKTTR